MLKLTHDKIKIFRQYLQLLLKDIHSYLYLLNKIQNNIPFY